MEASKNWPKKRARIRGTGPLSSLRAGIRRWNDARKAKKSFRKQKKGFWKGCGKKGDPRYRAENCTDPETKNVAKYGGTLKKRGAAYLRFKKN